MSDLNSPPQHHHCLKCGSEFLTQDPEAALCEGCGGPPEAQELDPLVTEMHPEVISTKPPKKEEVVTEGDSPTYERYCLRDGSAFLTEDPDEQLCEGCRERLEGESLSTKAPPEAVLTEAGEEGIPTEAPRGEAVVTGGAGLTLAPGGATVGPAGTVPPSGGSYRSEDEVPEEWDIGDTVLDLYKVKESHPGGMGIVYRVHHTEWDTDLAVKTPKKEMLDKAGGREGFVKEAEAWVDLGLHPNIVTCFYVRTLGGIPRVFAEWVDGGSLSDWIKSGRLYEGEEALGRMLDIAIQFAWGLDHTHSKGNVHQDVKPANVMLTPGGVAKVTDFGLVGGAGPTGVYPAGDGTMLVTGGGLTPAYCSPEQASGEKLTRRTDIWSWGLSILEMFAGGVFWATVPGAATGRLAPEALSHYLAEGPIGKGIPPMPDSLASLLGECFTEDPEARPHDMSVVADALKNTYGECTGKKYPREKPDSLELRATSLNNRAISLYDLGRRAEALETVKEALAIDTAHPEATYNRAMLLWERAEITDMEAVEQVAAVVSNMPLDWRSNYLLGLVHIARKDGASAAGALREAQRLSRDAPEPVNVLERMSRDQKDWPRELKLLEAHEHYVAAVAFYPDGKHALSGGRDDSLRVWDLENGCCTKTFGEGKTVHSVAVSINGKQGLSGGWGDTYLWDLESGQCANIFKGAPSDVNSVKFSSDGKYAISGSGDLMDPDRNSGRRWNIATDEERDCLGVSEAIMSVDFCTKGNLFISASEMRVDGNYPVGVFDLEKESMSQLVGHEGPVTSVVFAFGGRMVLSGSYDQTCRLWDVGEGVCARVMKGHKGAITSVAVLSDERHGLSCGGDGTVRVWDLERGLCVRTIEVPGSVMCGSASPAGGEIIFGSEDGSLRLWDVSMVLTPLKVSLVPARASSTEEDMNLKARFINLKEKAETAFGENDYARAASVVKEIRQLPGYERDPEVMADQARAGLKGTRSGLSGAWLLHRLEAHHAIVNSVAIHPDGKLGVSGGGDGTLRFWDLQAGRLVSTYHAHEKGVGRVAVSHDGVWALSTGGDHTVRLWDMNAPICLLTMEHQASILCAAFSPDRRLAVSGSVDEMICVWDLEQRAFAVINEESSQVATSLAFSPAGDCVLSGRGKYGLQEGGSRNFAPRLWELAGGRCINMLKGINPHADWVNSVAISTDGSLALSGGGNPQYTSKDNALRLWELDTCDCIKVLEGHSDAVDSVAISADGKYAVSGSHDRTVRVWDLEAGNCIRVLEGHLARVTSVAISNDGRFVLSSSHDETVRIWELDWEYDFREPADWDEGAQPYIENFLTVHTPFAGELPRDHPPDEEEMRLALSRHGTPTWTQEDFGRLVYQLGCAGYGWLRPEGVRKKLEELASKR